MARSLKENETETEAPIGASVKILPVDSFVIKAGEAPPLELLAKAVRVKIVKRFRLNRQDHTTQVFDPAESNCYLPGYYDVTAEDAAHPYLIAHTDKAPPPLYEPGTLAYAEEQQRELKRQHIQKLVARRNESEAMAEVRRQNLAVLRERMGGDKSGLEDVNA
jgi:hypothetical protein